MSLSAAEQRMLESLVELPDGGRPPLSQLRTRMWRAGLIEPRHVESYPHPKFRRRWFVTPAGRVALALSSRKA